MLVHLCLFIVLSHDRHISLNEDGNVILQYLHLINTSDRKHNQALPIPDHSVAPLLCRLFPSFSDSAYTVHIRGHVNVLHDYTKT